MSKVILVHAHCASPSAKGDFTFAGSIALDISRMLTREKITDIQVVLGCERVGLPRFISLYGEPVAGFIVIADSLIGLSCLEEFDTVCYTVVAFLDTGCVRSPANLVKRVLSPVSKIAFVGNVHWEDSFCNPAHKKTFLADLACDNPVYEFFDEHDFLLGCAGFGLSRLGIPSLDGCDSLLEAPVRGDPSRGDYGVIYLNPQEPSLDYPLIIQYIKLSRKPRYILVGDLEEEHDFIKRAYECSFPVASSAPFPRIDYYESLPNSELRQLFAASKSTTVLTTGIGSTMEAMYEGRLPYYQYTKAHYPFVQAYLLALKNSAEEASYLSGTFIDLIVELSTILFAVKPLAEVDLLRVNELLHFKGISSNLIALNQELIKKTSTLAPRLFSFFNAPHKTKLLNQVDGVCRALRAKDDAGNSLPKLALRRAAACGLLFELKVLVNFLVADLDEADSIHGYTALHHAVMNNHLDCVRILVKAGASLDKNDAEEKTPLGRALTLGLTEITKALNTLHPSLEPAAEGIALSSCGI